METRSCPSRVHLQSLAEQVSYPVPDGMSKPELYRKLQENYSVERLERRFRLHGKDNCYHDYDTESSDSSSKVTFSKKRKKRRKKNSPSVQKENSIGFKKNKRAKTSKAIATSSVNISNEKVAASPIYAQNECTFKGETCHPHPSKLEESKVSSLCKTTRIAHSPSSPLKQAKRKARKRNKRRRYRRNRNNAKKLTALGTSTFDDTMDPIMRTKLGKHIFAYTRPNGKTIKYNVDSLVEYMLATGDFCEPESRIPFTKKELKQLDDLSNKAGLDTKSVLHASQNKQKYDEINFRRDALLGLERCAGELICEILKLIERVSDGEEAPDDAETRLLLEIFPLFVSYYESIKASDSEFAKQCLKQYKSFVCGPPNRPTDNAHGFRDTVLQVLDQVSNGECSGRDFGITAA